MPRRQGNAHDTARRTAGDGHAKPQADHAERAKTLVQRIADLRAWLFLAALIVVFEVWARTAFGGTFILNPFNLQSIAIFAVAPLLLATGQTFVIISGGIDLSIGFIMGLAAVVAAHVINAATPALGLARRRAARLHRRRAGRLRARASSTACWSRASRCRPSSARSACSAWRAASPSCSPAARRCRCSNSLLRRASATAGSSACPIIVLITAVFMLGHALPAEPDPVRPAQLRHRRQRAGRAPRRHRRQVAPLPPLRAVGRLRRPRRRALRRALQRRRRAGRRAAAARLASPRS